MAVNTDVDILRIKELDVDIIPPNTAEHKKADYGGAKIVCIGKPGTGKCLAPGTMVMMFDGSCRKVEDIKTGDLLMGDDSSCRTVLSTCEGIDEMFEIIQESGINYTVNAPHILSLKLDSGEVVDISVNDFLSLPAETKIKYFGYKATVSFIPESFGMENMITKISIRAVGQGKYYGFQLDGNHRFLLGDFTVTHNTTLIASLLYAKKHIFPVGVAFSGTEDSNHFYRSVMPSTFVFNTYDEGQIEKFIKRQKISKDHLENPWAVIIIDDCTDDPSLFRKPLQNGMYKRGRHWKMWYILSLQYGMDVRPVIRTNVDGVFILREPNMRNRKVMYENYASIIPDFKLFCDILDQITNDYTALYIHNTTRSNDWRDCVFWYKAKPIPSDFKFGCDDYWAFHYARYNPEYVDPITV